MGWGLGVFCYQLLYNEMPFWATDFDSPNWREEVDKLTCEHTPEFPEVNGQPISGLAIDFMKKLLEKDSSNRLGSGGTKAVDEIFSHPWFEGKYTIEKLNAREYAVPFKPNADDINAPSKDEIAAFPKLDVELTDEEKKRIEKWPIINSILFEAEMVNYYEN